MTDPHSDLDRLLGQTIDKPLLEELKHTESQVAKLKEELETVNDKLGNELQVKYLEIEGLKEEVRILMKGTEVLGITIEQLKSTLDEIKTYNSKWLNNIELEEILAKHEDNV
jgi:FtsZ-binding cell division protein ZapB